GARKPKNPQKKAEGKERENRAAKEPRKNRAPVQRGGEIYTQTPAESEEDNIAEINVPSVPDHQVEVARERDIDRCQQHAFAQPHVVGKIGKERTRCRKDEDEPRVGSAELVRDAPSGGANRLLPRVSYRIGQ